MPDAPETAPTDTEEAPAEVHGADEPAKEEAEAAAGGGEAADAEDAGEAVEAGGEEEEEQEEEEDDGSPPPPSSFAGHHIDRLKQDASYVVFYGVTAEGEAHMIAAGLDTRFSGHFVYQSHPKLPGEALRCTNRNVVMEWLRALGATEPVEQQALKEVPDVAADVERAKRLNMLNASRGAGGVIRTRPSTSSQRLPTRSQTPPSSTGRPGSAKEEAPEKLYQTYREEAGELPDGRHYKHYYLVDADGQDVLAVVAEDGARKDRRYTYKATTAFGGKRFENSRTAQAWLLRFTESGANENEKAGEGADGDRDGAGASKHKALSEDAMKSVPVAPDHEHLFHIGADMAAQDLKDAFRDQPPLLGWVTATPSDVLLSTFRLYAGELKAYVGDRPPEFTPEGSPLQTWTPTPRAIEILTHLTHHPVSLSLLDKSGISKPLASLRTHVNYQVATLANRITARWREISDAALQRASEAINSYGTFTQGGHAPPAAAAATPAAATPAAAGKADGKPAAASTAQEQQPGSVPPATEAGGPGTGPGDAMELDAKENNGSGGAADGNAGKSTAAADVAAGTADAPAAAAAATEPADAQNGPGDAAMDVDD